MLVIRRHTGQSIRVGEAEIQVIECGHNRVKLGISAARDIPVVRTEVELTREQNLTAARPVSPAALSGVLRDIRGFSP
ncbi:MAG: carbon storage regulator [Acidobacteriia bacterium]|nr:carbon storage regulator [Terriglobia bacterium]